MKNVNSRDLAQNINRPYDITKASSIFEYSKKLLDKCLRDFIYDNYSEKSGKGQVGQMVEEIFFLIKNNNDSRADFSEAGLELKCTPLKQNSKGEYTIKERLVCCMIDYCEVVKEDFKTSHLYLKCRLMLLLFYLHNSLKETIDLTFIYSVLWQLPEKDLLIIENDYNTIVNKIREGHAQDLSEGDTLYLGACRKGQKGDNPVKQPYSDIYAPKRAFSLKAAYMRTILKYVEESGEKAIANFKIKEDELVSEKELASSNFEAILLKRFEPCIGKDYREIASLLNIDLSNNPKSKFSIISSKIASVGRSININKSEEFCKSGLLLKTIRIEANGLTREAMSFENIDYIEVDECEDWYDSRLYEIFSRRFFFVVYREQNKKTGDYVLDDVFFWAMPKEDLETAQEYWEHIKLNIKDNHISDEYWWKESNGKKFHVRPKARNTEDLAPTPNGEMAKKYCYWFNKSYVRDILEKRRGERIQ